jgi:HlyD family secretion protein
LARAQERLTQQKAERQRLESDSGVPLPTEAEGELNVARANYLAANAAVEKLMVRAPIAATVLAVNARAGEIASPAAPQPLVILGDLSAMRVRAELDERDFGKSRWAKRWSCARPICAAANLPERLSRLPRSSSRAGFCAANAT